MQGVETYGRRRLKPGRGNKQKEEVKGGEWKQTEGGG